MDKKKIIKTVVIIFIVFFGLIAAENIIRGVAKVTEDITRKSQIKKEQKEYEKTEEYQVETYLESSIKKTVEYINSGDFASIYNLLDPEYKDYKNFKSLDEFEEYMLNYIGMPKSATLVGYERSNDKYVCDIAVTTETTIETYKVLVKPLNDDAFTIIFDDISSIQNLTGKHTYSDKNASYNIRYKVADADIVTYSIDITNNTNKVLKGSLVDTYLKKSNGKSYYIDNKDEMAPIEIAPQETKRVNVSINIVNAKVYEDILLVVKIKDENGNEISGNIVLEKNYWE